MISERDFVRQLQHHFPIAPPVEVGIGDDGAVLRGDNRQIVVTDMLLDGRHFDTGRDTAFLIGRKSVAVNLSDIAAMAGRPTAAFVSVAFCRQQPAGENFVQELYAGIAEICQQSNVTLAGGDTNSWDGPFAISVTVIGEPIDGSAILRSTAQAGDVLFVTGTLGGSLPSGHHLSFRPRQAEVEWLLQNNVRPNALMDISDGLAIDLHRLAEASSVGARLHAQQIPIADTVAADLPAEERLSHALEDGEDFELLGTISHESFQRIHAELQPPFKLSAVGEITKAQELILITSNGQRPLTAAGWQHL